MQLKYQNPMTIINLIMKLYKYRGKDARGKYHCPTFTAIFMIFHYFCLFLFEESDFI